MCKPRAPRRRLTRLPRTLGSPLAGPQVVKIFRDGSKEVIEQMMPPIPGQRDKEYHGHLLYDFQAHRLYTQVLSDPGTPCGVQEYNDPWPRPESLTSSAAQPISKKNSPVRDK